MEAHITVAAEKAREKIKIKKNKLSSKKKNMEFVSSIAHNWRRERVKCAFFVLCS